MLEAGEFPTFDLDYRRVVVGGLHLPGACGSRLRTRFRGFGLFLPKSISGLQRDSGECAAPTQRVPARSRGDADNSTRPVDLPHFARTITSLSASSLTCSSYPAPPPSGTILIV